MDKFLLATLGGELIGLSASIMLLVNGRVTGVSGILSSIVDFKQSKDSPRKDLFCDRPRYWWFDYPQFSPQLRH